MKTPNWISQHPDGVLVRFHVQPKASRSEICGEHGDRLKVRIAAPPVDGAANEELLRFLKTLTGLPGAKIHLIRGETSRSKDILFSGASIEALLVQLKIRN